MLDQTGNEWSAPLDDVFIHFDYARATARGYPFEWTEGNGYSSGNTSLSYPFVLALGYWLGAREMRLMVWAATVAAISVFGFLWVARRFFRGLGPVAPFTAPLALFSVGALGWSLWSGMEVAFFLGVWALAAVIALAMDDDEIDVNPGGWALGAAGVLVVTTRPEGASSIAALGVFAAAAAFRKLGVLSALATLARAGVPAALALACQSIANRVLTGESTANGALVKLAYFHPYMDRQEKLADYLFNLEYSLDRLHLHHFGEPGDHYYTRWGYYPLVLALIPLLDRRTRARAVLLIVSALSWVALVAMNGQVRWQNERYLMPAVAWELLLAAMGVSVMCSAAASPKSLVSWLEARWFGAKHGLFTLLRIAASILDRVVLALGSWPVRLIKIGIVVAMLSLWWKANRVQYRDQVWFFARACRNIRDQHITAGRMLRKLNPPADRVLVGDAGAILYAADVPGFDLIGLGGFHNFPLARAGVQGLPASLELIERLPHEDRPDVMAIYPTWWGPLPAWFGRRLFGVPVAGNVICGGAEKVVYEADWHLLDTGAFPRSISKHTPILDEVDIGDLISEREHDYRFPQPHGGYVDMRVLSDPPGSGQDLWDAGRHIPFDRPETMVLHHLPAGHAVRLIVRTTADQPVKAKLSAGSFTGEFRSPAALGWQELTLDLPAHIVTQDLAISILPTEGDWVPYHLWVVPIAPKP
ncbi:MAG: hypothetical protein U0165_10485 [Polyangiaceae bacterium]